jgi:hypothetical protein
MKSMLDKSWYSYLQAFVYCFTLKVAGRVEDKIYKTYTHAKFLVLYSLCLCVFVWAGGWDGLWKGRVTKRSILLFP